MPDLSILATPAPYHVLSFGTLLGSQFFQTFINGIVSYRALPRPQFSSLQKAIFPYYFSLQSALPVIVALTYPGTRNVVGLQISGLGGVLAPENRMSVLLPILTVLTTSLVNLVIVGPATTKIMAQRKHQETRDGKKSYDSPPHSKEMTRLNKAFGKIHGTSALLNLVGFCGTLWYGVTLAARLQ